MYIRAEPLDITKGKKDFLIKDDVLFTLDLSFANSTPIEYKKIFFRRENISGVYNEKTSELTITINGVKLGNNKFFNKLKMSCKKLFHKN